MKSNLPNSILNKAYISTSNEFAWKKEDISEALDSILNLGHYIAGGDIWIINEKGIMEIPGFSSNIIQSKNESRKNYEKRMKDEFLDWINSIENSFSYKNENEIFYLITFI